MREYYVLYTDSIKTKIVELKDDLHLNGIKISKNVKSLLNFYKVVNKREEHTDSHWPLLILNIDPMIAISTDL